MNTSRGNRRRSEHAKDAWIYPFEPALASALVADLERLGYTPVRRLLDESIDVERNAAGERPPALVVVATGSAECDRAGSLTTSLRAVDELRETPILIATDVTTLDADVPIPAGDEVLVAPWSTAELALRTSRATQRLGLAGDGDVVRIGGLEIDFTTYQVTIDRAPVDFTYMEYELLRFFVTHPNRVFSREALLSRVWGYDFYGETRTVDVHVRRVRAKLGVEYAARILTVRSVGYRFER
ncbi:MAG TPA: winged helix-turn-helix domain-containing protein, partial [Solirubrobacteraceae bacterium]|nr:winged helix-turn-helix domain-containing protein [Solirubrobacteraceae bacterium]